MYMHCLSLKKMSFHSCSEFSFLEAPFRHRVKGRKIGDPMDGSAYRSHTRKHQTLDSAIKTEMLFPLDYHKFS